MIPSQDRLASPAPLGETACKMSKRQRKPSKKAASPASEPDDEEDSEVETKAPPVKKTKSPKKPPASKPKAADKEEAASDEDEEEKDPQPKKRKGYAPKKGTANHAFMIVLLEAHNKGEEHLTKAELMKRADESGLSEKPIFGTEESKAATGFPVDGWTNSKTLKKHELIIAEGRPLKIRLTPEGTSVAEDLAAA